MSTRFSLHSRLIASLLIVCLVFLFIPFTPYASDATASYVETTLNNPDGSTTRLTYQNKNSYSFVEAFVDDTLTQRAYFYPDKDEIVIEYFQDGIATHSSETYAISEFVKDVAPSDVSTDHNISPLSLALYGVFPPSPTLAGSKTCYLYFQNYDEEPDLHRYMAKRLTFSAGTAVSIVFGLVIDFVSGNFSFSSLLSSLGTSAVGDYIQSRIDGNVCFSTQKIMYFPQINGSYVWNDAHITKRWVITYDYIAQRESFHLDNPSYSSNRGATPEQIAFNAQAATM